MSLPGHPVKITSHTLVKNESRWVWYALMSVLDYVDEALIWDTGSTDDTVKIIRSINNPKIKFRQYGSVSAEGFTRAHNEMLKETHSEWLLIVDGDEIWPVNTIRTLREAVLSEGDSFDFFIHHVFNLLGDVYHYQEEAAGKYHLGKYAGQYNLRALNLKRNPGLHYEKPHGQIGLFDNQGQLIQNREKVNYKLLSGSLLHATHLQRSTSRNLDNQVIKRSQKFKHELGHKFSSEFTYPEVFYLPRPQFVPDPWIRRPLNYFIPALVQTPLKMIKRRLLPVSGSGY